MIRLTLPLPASFNRMKSAAFAHPMQEVRMKNEYKRTAWVVALTQEKPLAEPPERVVVRSTFYVKGKRDEDGLSACLKYVLDALKLRGNDGARWKAGLYDEKAYFTDDAPDACTVEKPEQYVDRKNPRLVLEIEPA